MSQSPELRQDYWCNGDVTPTNGVRGAPVRNPVLLVERIERLPPIGACRRATPLVRRKFVENRHLQVTHCQRRFQCVFTQVIEIRCIAATTSVFSQAKADLGLIGTANTMVKIVAATRLKSIVSSVRNTVIVLELV
jgi:hypothetical protein